MNLTDHPETPQETPDMDNIETMTMMRIVYYTRIPRNTSLGPCIDLENDLDDLFQVVLERLQFADPDDARQIFLAFVESVLKIERAAFYQNLEDVATEDSA